MKKLMPLPLLVAFIAAALFISTAFTPKKTIIATSDDCTEWIRSNSTYMQMKWCVDEYGEVSYQFYNGYSFEVHYWYKFECTDGRSYTGNNYLNSAAQSERADMMKSKPNLWYITRKERKDNSGQWVSF